MTPRERAMELHDEAIRVMPTDHPLAWKMIDAAVRMDPDFAVGWYLAAHTAVDQGRLEAGVSLFRRCLACARGDSPGGLNRDFEHRATAMLGHQLYRLGRLSEARHHTRRAIHGNPESGVPYLNLSILDSIEGYHDTAIAHATRAFALEPAPVTELGLAFAHLFAGNYATGLKHFECRFEYKLKQFLRFPYPRWEGQSGDVELLIVSDQGMGDTLSFLRFVPEVLERVGTVRMSVQPELVRLINGMFFHEIEAGRIDVIPLPVQFCRADYWVSFMSLPVALGLTDKEIRDAPNIAFPSCVTGNTWKNDQAKLHIGIAWAGNKDNDIDLWRTLPVTDFLPVAEIPGVQLYSLQVGERANDIHDKGLAPLIRDMVPLIRDVADTAAVINNLDCLVVVEGFHHHLAGAMGKPCHVLLNRTGGDWRCGRTGKHPLWYPNTILHRERCYGNGDRDWSLAWWDVCNAIRTLIQERQDNVGSPSLLAG